VKFFLYRSRRPADAGVGHRDVVLRAVGHRAGTFDWATLTTIVSHAPLGTQIWLFMGSSSLRDQGPARALPHVAPGRDRGGPGRVGVLLSCAGQGRIFGFCANNLPLFPRRQPHPAPLLLVLAVAGVLYGSIWRPGRAT